jgi:hypothetical protein
MLSIYGLLTRCPVRAGRDRRSRRRSRVLFDGGKGALIEGYVDLGVTLALIRMAGMHA